MKLLLCQKCGDVRALQVRRWVQCECGACRASYTDDDGFAEIGGDHAVLLGFNNTSLVSALQSQNDEGDLSSTWGRNFEAFIIPKSAPSVRWLD